MSIWKTIFETVSPVLIKSCWSVGQPVEEEEPEYTYGDNLITNTSFDVDLDGWTYTWGVANCDATEQYEGDKCALLRRGGGASMALYTEIPTEIGAIYEFTVYCKVGIQNDSTVVYLCAGTGHSITINDIADSIETDAQYETTYKKLTLVFTAIGEITTISIRHKETITDEGLGYASKGYADNAVCRKRTLVT